MPCPTDAKNDLKAEVDVVFITSAVNVLLVDTWYVVLTCVSPTPTKLNAEVDIVTLSYEPVIPLVGATIVGTLTLNGTIVNLIGLDQSLLPYLAPLCLTLM